MSRNKTVNPDKTKRALQYFYDVAKQTGKLSQLLQVGGYQEGAIRTAINRGALSQKMIDSIVKVFAVDPRILTGEIDLPNINELENSPDVMSDEQMLKIIQLIVETKDFSNIAQKNNNIISEIKVILTRYSI